MQPQRHYSCFPSPPCSRLPCPPLLFPPLLSSSLPSSPLSETEQGIFEAVLRGHLDFDSDPWPSISEDAKDLIRGCCNLNPHKRLTAYQVLCEWSHKPCGSSSQLLSSHSAPVSVWIACPHLRLLSAWCVPPSPPPSPPPRPSVGCQGRRGAGQAPQLGRALAPQAVLRNEQTEEDGTPGERHSRAIQIDRAKPPPEFVTGGPPASSA